MYTIAGSINTAYTLIIHVYIAYSCKYESTHKKCATQRVT